MLKKIITFIFILTAICFITGCGGTNSEKELSNGSTSVLDELTAGRIQGIITASVTGLPIPNAVVETGDLQAVTDENGKFIIGPIMAGDYRVIARAAGFEITYKDNVRVYQGKITENINFNMNPAEQSYSSDFSVIAVRPQYGTDGDTIDVYCNGCGTTMGRVTFNGKDATIVSWNASLDGKITVLAPSNVETGIVRVYIDGKSSNESQFITFIAKPVVAFADPAIASGGARIWLLGRNFNPIPTYNHVKLNDKDCYVNSVSDNNTRLNITIPLDAKTGVLTAEIRSDSYTLEGIGSATLTIIPKLVYLTPQRTVPTTNNVLPILTLYGYNFGTDKNIVKVMFGDTEIPASEFLTFSDTSLSLYAPRSSVVSPGVTVEVKVKVNQSVSNPMRFTAYNSAAASLNDKYYGIYDYDTIAPSGTFKLATLRPSDRLVFLSILSGNSAQSLETNSQYSFSSFMGGNYTEVPRLPESLRAAIRSNSRYNKSGNVEDTYNGILNYSSLNDNSKYLTLMSPPRAKYNSNIRASLEEPATTTIKVYIRDFTSDDPWNYENDKVATGTLIASGTHTLIYYDINQSGMTTGDANIIVERFDSIYNILKNTFGIDNPPEGNVDEQTRIVLFFSPLLNNANPAIMSYFDTRDKSIASFNSAGTEIIYANSVGYLSDNMELYASLAESLHKMFYYNQKRVSGVYYGTSWIEAGLGCIARDKSGYGLTAGNSVDCGRISSYLSRPYAYGLNDWPDEPVAGNYGMQHLFSFYLNQFCSAYDPIIKLEGTSGGSNLHKDLADIEYLLDKAGIYDFNSFFEDFCMAMYLDNLGLDSSFTGYDPTKYQFTDLNLRSGSWGGLRGGSLGEGPVPPTIVDIKANGCRLFAYPEGNWGDIETTITRPPTGGKFKTYIIYYSAENIQ